VGTAKGQIIEVNIRGKEQRRWKAHKHKDSGSPIRFVTAMGGRIFAISSGGTLLMWKEPVNLLKLRELHPLEEDAHPYEGSGPASTPPVSASSPAPGKSVSPPPSPRSSSSSLRDSLPREESLLAYLPPEAAQSLRTPPREENDLSASFSSLLAPTPHPQDQELEESMRTEVPLPPWESPSDFPTSTNQQGFDQSSFQFPVDEHVAPSAGTASLSTRAPCLACGSQEERRAALYRCGHTCVCPPCGGYLAASHGPCPECGQPVQDSISVFE